MTRFVILSAPRSGSNLLCTLLQSHEAVLCHHEIFNPRGVFVALPLRASGLEFGGMARRDADPLAFLDAVWRDDRGHTCVGFKFTRGQNQRVLDHVVENAEVRKIILRRRNRVKTLASELIAEAEDRWEVYDDDPPITNSPKVSLKPAAIDAHTALNRSFYEGIIERLESNCQHWLDLAYEDLFDVEQHRRLTAFLGLPATEEAPKLQAASRKQNSRDLRDLIVNFDELDRCLRGTEFHRELHDRET